MLFTNNGDISFSSMPFMKVGLTSFVRSGFRIELVYSMKIPELRGLNGSDYGPVEPKALFRVSSRGVSLSRTGRKYEVDRG